MPTHNKKSPQIPSEGHTILYKLLIIVVFIFAMQFCDSFCTELFSKLQSLYTTDFLIIGCRTDFADIQNKKECGGNRQWQNHYLRNWAANTKGKGII